VAFKHFSIIKIDTPSNPKPAYSPMFLTGKKQHTFPYQSPCLTTAPIASSPPREHSVETNTHSFFVTCAKGTEGPLRKELVKLRIRGPKGAMGGVSFRGTMTDAFKVCLHSRIAMRVLLQLAERPVFDADSLYDLARTIDWSEFIHPQNTIAVRASSRDNANLHHAGFVALKVKDAIVDSIRDRLGWRPDVDPHAPHIAVFIHLCAESARIYLDLSGAPLHRRGYRHAMVPAPLKESLAAAILSLSNVSPEQPFIDPMTGSGTLSIEHALATRHIAPGLKRTHSFERWISADYQRIWESLKRQAVAAELPNCPAPILARDIDPSAVEAARKNAQVAGVSEDMVFEVGDVGTLKLPTVRGVVGMNPPYGERLDPATFNQSAMNLQRTLGRFFSTATGWKIFCVTGTPEIPGPLVSARPAISHRLWNGPIETRLLVYNL
jgi:putative N6-adenine-specific DNA methylase